MSCPLLALPVEVLHRILEYVPDQKKRIEAWRSAIVDISMLLPISQTCRHLRDITLLSPALWDSVSTTEVPVLRGMAGNTIALSRSRRLSAFLLLDESYSKADPDGRYVKTLWPSVVARVRELRVELWFRHTVADPWDIVFQQRYPELDSVSLYNMTYPDFPFLPLTRGSTAHLRRLDIRNTRVLPRCDFPRLTHLALGGTNMPTYASVVGLLRRCPNIESLVMHNIRHQPAFADPKSYPDLSLPRLRRVLLKNMSSRFLPLYLEKIPMNPRDFSLQLVGTEGTLCDSEEVIRHYSLAPPQTIRISLEPLLDSEIWHALSVTLLSAQTMLSIGTSIRYLSYIAEGPAWLGRTLQDKSALGTVTELWLINLPWDGPEGDWRNAFDESLRSIIAALPALEAVSIAVDRAHHTALPGLRLLPDGREPGFDSPRLRTVRLVYGFDRVMEYRKIIDAGEYGELLKPRETKELSLATLLNQLRTGAFDYLDRLILRVASCYTFDEAELVQLRGFVSEVVLEYNDEKPEMPLPEYAREPEASVCSSYYWGGAMY